jgi:hypothetical protein
MTAPERRGQRRPQTHRRDNRVYRSSRITGALAHHRANFGRGCCALLPSLKLTLTLRLETQR